MSGNAQHRLVEWIGRLVLLGAAAVMVVPMGQGDPEHGFFFVAGFAADLWLAQWVNAIYENRRRPRALLSPLLLLKGVLIIGIVVAAAVRGRLSEVLAMTFAAGVCFGLLGLGAVLVFSAQRMWAARAARKRH